LWAGTIAVRGIRFVSHFLSYKGEWIGGVSIPTDD